MRRRFDMWSGVTVLFLALFALILVYPMFLLLKESVVKPQGQFTWENFVKFFSQPYYSRTIGNSFKVTVAITFVTLLLGIPLSYFYSF